MNTQAGCEQGNGLTLLKIVRKDEKCLIYKYIFKRKEGKYAKQAGIEPKKKERFFKPIRHCYRKDYV